MSFRYPIQSITLVDGYRPAIENNKENIIRTISQYSQSPLTLEMQESVIREILDAAEWSVAAIVYDGPRTGDKKWQDAIKAVKNAIAKIQALDPVDFNYLDASLRRDDDTYSLLKYYSKFYITSPKDKVITVGGLCGHLVKSLILVNDLFRYSLKGTSKGRNRERDPLKQYCYSLYKIFNKQTGLPFTINSPYERFAWQCLLPLQGVIQYAYTEESLTKSIRELQHMEMPKTT